MDNNIAEPKTFENSSKYHKENKMTNQKQTENNSYVKDKLLQKYIHDIRNMEKLTKEMIFNISNMSHEDKMNIILIQNDVIQTLKETY
jgi:hypothetical protein